jgi:hypothetical protein
VFGAARVWAGKRETTGDTLKIVSKVSISVDFCRLGVVGLRLRPWSEHVTVNGEALF